MAITKQQLIDWAKSKGWEEDNFGHLQKQANGKQYRFKLSSIAVRYETKVKSIGEWIRLQSGYFKDLTITEDGKLAGLTR